MNCGGVAYVLGLLVGFEGTPCLMRIVRPLRRSTVMWCIQGRCVMAAGEYTSPPKPGRDGGGGGRTADLLEVLVS